jgi:cytochrome bd-type quinol oxidase subunit 2
VTPFEYVLAFVSIVVGLAVADLATSLHRLLRARDRVRWDWLALTTAVLAALAVLQFWWSFFRTGHAPVWRVYGAFLPLLALVVVLVLLAAAALPDEVPPGGLDLGAYYEGNARYFWVLFALLIALAAVVSLLPALGRKPLGPLLAGQLPNLGVAALAGGLALVPRRRYHRIAVPLLALTLGLLWARLRLDPPA